MDTPTPHVCSAPVLKKLKGKEAQSTRLIEETLSNLTFITSLAFLANPGIQKPYEARVRLTAQEIHVASTPKSNSYCMLWLVPGQKAKPYVAKIMK